MALPQDGQNANGLTKVTEVPTGKELIFVDPTTNEGGIITLEDLTTQILNKLTSKIFTLDQGNITLIEALNKLNSNPNLMNLDNDIENFLNTSQKPRAYFVWGTIGGLFGGWAWGILICSGSIRTSKLDFVTFASSSKGVPGIKEYLITNKPESITIFKVGNSGCAIATPYNTYEKGYVGFLYFDYFVSSPSNLKLYSCQKGEWIS